MKSDCAITEFIIYRLLEEKIKLIHDPVVIMPRFIFTPMMNSLTERWGEIPAKRCQLSCPMECSKENVDHYKQMGITNPNNLADLAFTLYSKMGWFRINKIDRNEVAKTKTIPFKHTNDSKAFGNNGESVNFCTADILMA